jgi:hypothetical protein
MRDRLIKREHDKDTYYFLIIYALFLSGCTDGQDAYTLYRANVLDRNMRVHMATFDAKDGAAYNRENCEITARLFQAQPGVTVAYWCEPGRYLE